MGENIVQQTIKLKKKIKTSDQTSKFAPHKHNQPLNMINDAWNKIGSIFLRDKNQETYFFLMLSADILWFTPTTSYGQSASTPMILVTCSDKCNQFMSYCNHAITSKLSKMQLSMTNKQDTWCRTIIGNSINRKKMIETE